MGQPVGHLAPKGLRGGVPICNHYPKAVWLPKGSLEQKETLLVHLQSQVFLLRNSNDEIRFSVRLDAPKSEG